MAPAARADLRGQDMEVVADLTFEQAVFGAQIPVSLRLPQRCDDCGGSGAGESTKPVTCSECNGTGQVRRVRQSVLGQMVTSSPCQRCGGLGEVIVTPCPTCRGEGASPPKTYQVDVPAGVDTEIDAAPHRAGCGRPRVDVPATSSTSASLLTNATSATATTSSPTSRSRSPRRRSARLTLARSMATGLVVQAGTQPGREFVLRGRGVPRLQGRGRGDLRAIVRVDVPTKLTAEETALLRSSPRGAASRWVRAGQGLFSHQVRLLVNDEFAGLQLTSSSPTSSRRS